MWAYGVLHTAYHNHWHSSLRLSAKPTQCLRIIVSLPKISRAFPLRKRCGRLKYANPKDERRFFFIRITNRVHQTSDIVSSAVKKSEEAHQAGENRRRESVKDVEDESTVFAEPCHVMLC